MMKISVFLSLTAGAILASNAMAANLNERLAGLQTTALTNFDMEEVHARYLIEQWDFMHNHLGHADPFAIENAILSISNNSDGIGTGANWQSFADTYIFTTIGAAPTLPQPPIVNLPSVFCMLCSD